MVALDAVRWSIVWGQLAAYCLVFGAVHCRRRPLVVAGWRDTLALAVSCAGIVMVGPAELFMPHAAATRFGAPIWLLLGWLYFLAVVLVLIHQRPRLVIYHADRQQVRAALERTLAALDPGWTAAGNSFSLASGRLELRLDASSTLGCVTVSTLGDQPAMVLWHPVARGLRRELAGASSPSHTVGLGLVTVAALLGASIVYRLTDDPQSIAQLVSDLLRRR